MARSVRMLPFWCVNSWAKFIYGKTALTDPFPAHGLAGTRTDVRACEIYADRYLRFLSPPGERAVHLPFE
jgi:hypothetical protein